MKYRKKKGVEWINCDSFLRDLEPVCFSFFKEKISYLKKKITFKSFASACYNILKKSKSKKII